MYKKVKIAVYCPKADCEKIRRVMAEAGAGRIGNYSYCSFSFSGVGRFKPNESANPSIGKKEELNEVEEEKIEAICEYDKWQEVVAKIIEAHPYEEPAIDVLPLLN